MTKTVTSSIGKGVVILLLVLSGCASYSNTVKIDDATAARLKTKVTIYDSANVSAADHEVVKQIQATACSNEDAMDQLRYIAHSLGANGITKISCASLLGPILMQNCMTTVICDAVAIRVGAKINVAEKVEPAGMDGTAEKNVISQGEGFTLGTLPLVVTSYDAVGESNNIEIIFSGNYVAKGKVMKRDEKNNLAIISFEEFRKVPTGFRIFPSYRVDSGEDVYAIDYSASSQPGEKPTIRKGVISSTEGHAGDSRYFTISAADSPSNTGGPLLDTRGRVIGIVSPAFRKASSAGTEKKIPEGEGTYYALKSNVLLNLYPEIENLFTSEGGPMLPPQKIVEAYGDSVVAVIAR